LDKQLENLHTAMHFTFAKFVGAYSIRKDHINYM